VWRGNSHARDLYAEEDRHRGPRMADEFSYPLTGINVKLGILNLICESLLDEKMPDRGDPLSRLCYRARIVANASLIAKQE